MMSKQDETPQKRATQDDGPLRKRKAAARGKGIPVLRKGRGGGKTTVLRDRHRRGYPRVKSTPRVSVCHV